MTKNDGAASYRALHGPKPPRGYCTQISRAISPSSRCYEHLLVATGSINLGSNPDSAEEEQNDDTDRQAKWWHKNKAPILKGTPEAATMEAKEVGGNDKSKWARKEPLEGKRQAQDEELVYVRFETLGRNLNELSTSAINEKLVLSIFNQLLVPNPTFKIENNANDTEINEIRAQILSSSSTPTSTNSTVPNKCKSSMEKLLCRLIYPSCHFRRSDISALVRPPCREDCFLLKDVFCANLNWSKFGNVLSRLFNATLMSMINELDLENQGDLPAGRNESPHEAANEFNSSIHFYWPHEHSLRRCELLPPLRSIHFERFLSKRLLGADQKPNKMFSMGQVKSQVRAKWPICSNAHLTKAATSTRPTEASTFTTNSSSSSTNPQDCLKSPDGVDYMGIMNHTRSGQACQAWKSQRAHSHSRSVVVYNLFLFLFLFNLSHLTFNSLLSFHPLAPKSCSIT